MPIYEYQCNKCGKTFETLVMGGRQPEACELCGAKRIKKLMSACGFHTKDRSGLTVNSSAGTSACSGCSSTACGSCGSG
ncbi:MAG: zinc ribbon domain-containing protein [Thermodesulfobacteriota bacterium]|nr:zinc ribbon domain-containing protein [Thermodesulfobacteriota bacterium]